MLSHVFNSKRKTNKQSRKFSTIAASIRRAQSPPSPASFVSPEIVEINEKGPFGAAFPDGRGPSTSIEQSVTSPQIELSFDTGELLQSWLTWWRRRRRRRMSFPARVERRRGGHDRLRRWLVSLVP
ncbi:hypothetical protein OH76DRAFT_172146 [Lentinus brumalis]|uniref:Uncharacterized protein n=1 Tax=Lentinus brumalis TaxID=2498619 RepID=A0A371DJA4_9APHY|nr:hypothetical protein OH76DRAFT_172146 [Polyporus brumalis]